MSRLSQKEAVTAARGGRKNAVEKIASHNERDIIILTHNMILQCVSLIFMASEGDIFLRLLAKISPPRLRM
jgi:hypothetical protein